MPAFEKRYDKFDYFDSNETDTDIWTVIIKELEKMKQNLANNPNSQYQKLLSLIILVIVGCISLNTSIK